MNDSSFSLMKKGRGLLFLTKQHILFCVIGHRNHGLKVCFDNYYFIYYIELNYFMITVRNIVV